MGTGRKRLAALYIRGYTSRDGKNALKARKIRQRILDAYLGNLVTDWKIFLFRLFRYLGH